MLSEIPTYSSFAHAGERLVDRLVRDAEFERRALVASLRATPASIPPKYFYDALGCALYGAICELPEYYPTRTEAAIFAHHRLDIATLIGRGKQLVDLGAGDCGKAAQWLPWLAPSRYVAVDIASGELERALARLTCDFPEIEVVGIVADFTHALDLRTDLGNEPATFFYPGSSIGNFTPDEALGLLRSIHAHVVDRPGSGLLIGVDTRKDSRRLVAAYDDALGVTAAFNRNVLNHVNRILGSDFDPRHFAHVAFFNDTHSRIEMHLEALEAQVVRIDGAPRRFECGERIHTENSYKYAPDEFAVLLRDGGFARVTRWSDPAGDFAVFHATA
ncbi:MAG TPA: L-histidine N(alpha)-methyltransferase [Casimicrobiaceae bacterium]|nr:L-histidine N(alpha)-methyltransferase [Casimicrobiaceae bacterium]